MRSIQPPHSFFQFGSEVDAREFEVGQFLGVSDRLETETPSPIADLLASEDEDNGEKQPERERIRLLLIGSPLGVTRTIQTLDRLSFVELHRWSQLITAPKQLNLAPLPGEVLSILTRYWLRN